jgi:hypothetical protein
MNVLNRQLKNVAQVFFRSVDCARRQDAEFITGAFWVVCRDDKRLVI